MSVLATVVITGRVDLFLENEKLLNWFLTGSGRNRLVGKTLTFLSKCDCNPEHWARGQNPDTDPQTPSSVTENSILAYEWVLSFPLFGPLEIHLLLTRAYFGVVVRLVHMTHLERCLGHSQEPSTCSWPSIVPMWAPSSLDPWYHVFSCFRLFVSLAPPRH